MLDFLKMILRCAQDDKHFRVIHALRTQEARLSRNSRTGFVIRW